jgi:hypothetical protein
MPCLVKVGFSLTDRHTFDRPSFSQALIVTSQQNLSAGAGTTQSNGPVPFLDPVLRIEVGVTVE